MSVPPITKRKSQVPLDSQVSPDPKHHSAHINISEHNQAGWSLDFYVDRREFLFAQKKNVVLRLDFKTRTFQ